MIVKVDLLFDLLFNLLFDLTNFGDAFFPYSAALSYFVVRNNSDAIGNVEIWWPAVLKLASCILCEWKTRSKGHPFVDHVVGWTRSSFTWPLKNTTGTPPGHTRHRKTGLSNIFWTQLCQCQPMDNVSDLIINLICLI